MGIGGQLGTCSVAAKTGGSGFTCFDYNTYNIGLVAIHVDGTGGTATRPAARVWTSTQCASTGSPFFSERDVVSPATTCKAAVFAVMRNASGPVTTANTFNAIVDGAGLNNVSMPFTYSAADGYWSTGYVYDVPTDGGAYDVSLRWRTGGGGGAQSYNNVQRIYSASDGSGPIKIVAATSSAPSQSPYAAPAGAVTLHLQHRSRRQARTLRADRDRHAPPDGREPYDGRRLRRNRRERFQRRDRQRLLDAVPAQRRRLLPRPCSAGGTRRTAFR